MDGITGSMDMGLGELRELVMDRDSWGQKRVFPLPPSQPAAFPSDLLRPSPNYRGTSGLLKV